MYDIVYKPGRLVRFNWKRYWYCKKHFPYAPILQDIDRYMIVLKGGPLKILFTENTITKRQKLKVFNVNNHTTAGMSFYSTWFIPVKNTEDFINLSIYI